MPPALLNANHRATLDTINKKYGNGTLIPLGAQPDLLRIPTGSFQLDLAMGGGWPVGRMGLVWGKKSAGKTTLCMHSMAQAQRLCRHDAKRMASLGLSILNSTLPTSPKFFDSKGKEVGESDATELIEVVQKDMSVIKIPELKAGYQLERFQEPMRCLLVNQEGTIDTSWARYIGVNVDDVLCLNTENAEHTIDIVDLAMREDITDLVVLDSIAALTPTKESEASTEDYQQGLAARLMNKAFRVWVATQQSYKDRPVRPTMLFVNQVREKIGVKYGSPDTKPGGNGQEFATSVVVKLQAPAPKPEDLAPEADGAYQLRNRINFKVEKNKTFPSLGFGQYMLATAPHDGYIKGAILNRKVILEAAKTLGILRKEKSKWLFGEDHKFTTLKALDKWATDNPAEFEEVVQYIKRHIVASRAGVPTTELSW